MSDTTNHDLHFDSENHTNDLADGELDERDLEVINGGCPPRPPNPLDVRRQELLDERHKLFNMGIIRYYPPR
jgi:hypothetical protein